MEETWELAVVRMEKPVSDALLLHQAISYVLSGSNGATVKERVAEYLNYSEDETGYAIIDILTLTNKVTTQIQAIDLPDRQKKLLQQRFSPIHKLMDFSTYAQPIMAFKTKVITENQADELLTIDLVLQGGGFSNPPLENDAVVEEILKTLVSEVKDSNLPGSLKNAILYRLLQIERSLRNAKILGSSVLLDDITKLVGALEIVTSEQKADSSEIKTQLSSVKAKIIAASKKIRSVRNYTKDAEFIIGSVQDVIPLIEQASS